MEWVSLYEPHSSISLLNICKCCLTFDHAMSCGFFSQSLTLPGLWLLQHAITDPAPESVHICHRA